MKLYTYNVRMYDIYVYIATYTYVCIIIPYGA